jgi:hypothetical protein
MHILYIFIFIDLAPLSQVHEIIPSKPQTVTEDQVAVKPTAKKYNSKIFLTAEDILVSSGSQHR